MRSGRFRITKDFFKEEYYSGQDFYEQIKLPHLVIFLKLQAYSEEEPYADIHTYDEFIKSSCLLLVLIYDCESVEIFSKDERITRSLFDNARRKGFFRNYADHRRKRRKNQNGHSITSFSIGGNKHGQSNT